MTDSADNLVKLLRTLQSYGMTNVAVVPGDGLSGQVDRHLTGDGFALVHRRADGQSAAFLALGLAAGMSRPSGLVPTEGAELETVEALAEADAQRVSMLFITSSAVDPLPMVRKHFDLSPPVNAAALATEAFAWAVGGRGAPPGPVQIRVPVNAQARSDRSARRPLADLDVHDVYPPFDQPDVSRLIEREPRTLVLLGRLPNSMYPPQARLWASSRGWPSIALPAWGEIGTHPSIGSGSLVLADREWVSENRPVRVMVIGDLDVDRSVADLLRLPDLRVEVIAPQGMITDLPVAAAAQHGWDVVGYQREPDGDLSWSARWNAAGQQLGHGIESALPWDCRHGVLRAVLSAPAERGYNVVLAPDLLQAASAVLPSDPSPTLTVCANHGLGAVDRTVSTAFGFAHGLNGPTVAVVNEASFLSDTAALRYAADERPTSLLILVLGEGQRALPDTEGVPVQPIVSAEQLRRSLTAPAPGVAVAVVHGDQQCDCSG